MTQDNDMLAMPVREFLSETAAKKPTPGGGSVAGLVGALGAALGQMALMFTQGKKKFAEHEDYYAKLGPRLEQARQRFEELVGEDVRAYRMYQSAAKMDDGDPGKPEAQKQALTAAINVPRQAADRCLALLDDLREFAGKCNPYLVSDLVASAALAAATLRLSDYNVRINARQVGDAIDAARLRDASRGDLEKGVNLLNEIEQAVGDHL